MDLFETERLILSKITLNDASFILELVNTPEWLAFIGDRKVYTVEDASVYIERAYLPSFKENGYGCYIVSLKDTGIPIGCCGLYKREELEYPDIGFAFLSEHLGKGYGYESALRIKEYAINELKFEKLLGFTVPANIASIKLLEKLGLNEKGTFKLKNDPDELLLFAN